MTGIAALRIAEDRQEWGVECAATGTHPFAFASHEMATKYAARCDQNGSRARCFPHRVVSRRVIVTEWETVDGEAQQ